MNREQTSAPGSARRSRLSRQLVLALTLSLLALCILFVTANAYVAKKTETTLTDFDSGTFLYTGLLDIPPDVDSVQLLPIGLTGQWQASSQPLPVALANLSAVASRDYIYVVGGTDNTHISQAGAYASHIELGADLTPWQTQPSLPAARAGASTILYPLNANTSMLYVIGGLGDDFYAKDTIFRGTVNNNTGAITSWTTDPISLPQALYYGAAVEHEDHIYVLGGFGGIANAVALEDVYYAPINGDGSLGSFNITTPLPIGLYNSFAVVYEGQTTDTLYVVGGRNNVTSTFQVYFADFLPGGGLSDWTSSEGKLPIHLYGHAGTLVNGGEIILTGGIADSLDPTTGISSTVKAALVDPENPSFRLYDWCFGVPPPLCTIGAWQTGALMPEVRALHATVADTTRLYVIGGEDELQDPRDTVFFGTVSGVGAIYSPEGTYISDEIALSQFPATLRKLSWDVTYGYPGQMSLSMEYRTSNDGQSWSTWSAPVVSSEGYNELIPNPAPDNIRYLQYRAGFSTQVSIASPLLNSVDIYYEVNDPDLQVIKNSGSVISANLGSNLVYTIYYTNTGHWTAPSAVLTETLPDHTAYNGGPEWHQIGASNVYSYAVGDVPPLDSGGVPFRVRIDTEVPEGTYYITNEVEIDYPPLVDAFDQTIVDPVPADNWYSFTNPLNIFAITVTKSADPPAGTTVAPGSFITYTIRYTNTGLRLATQAVLTDTFDDTGSYTILNMNPPPDLDGHIWVLGSLAPKQAGEIQVLVQVSDPMPNNWPVTNRAIIHSPEDEAEHTPIVTHTIVEPGIVYPDLQVDSVRWEPSSTESCGLMDFYATISNPSTQPVTGGFWVSLYIKPWPSQPPEWPSDHDYGYCLDGCVTTRPSYIFYVSDLAAGTSTEVPFVNLQADPNGFPGDGLYDVYVQVDVAFSGPGYNNYWGALPEEDEFNNILDGGTLNCGGPPIIYMPVVYRNSHR
ncbi:MAG: hypothetical protein PVJ34_18585 [Anaerolineae bacterium]|jgi:uncharacterized repeat protein (TIGR01451 family)